MILRFGTNIAERQVQFVGHQRTLCDSACCNTGNCCGLWEVLQHGVNQFQLHEAAQIEATKSDYDREKLQERLGKLAGGVAVLYVGAAAESTSSGKIVCSLMPGV